MTTATAQHLQTIRALWPALQDALATRQQTTWPPTMGIERLLDEQDRELAAAERAERNGDAPGERPVPIRLAVLDVMRAVEAALVELADQIAAQVQRPVVAAPATGRGWTDDLHRQAALLAARDSADQRRWLYSGQRTAPRAAEWLHDRVTGAPGPFRALTPDQHRHIANVAREAVQRIERSLGTARREQVLDEPCPHCRGQLLVEGGDGQPPTVHCRDCGRTWREDAAA